MHPCRYFPLILMAALLCACSSPGRKILARADAVMEENPDSAMTMLEQLDRSELGSSDLPYYALLMTQAQVKTDVPVDSDTLISLAYSKYCDDRRGDRGIRSNFYMGEVLFNQEKSRDAMRYYLSALEESKRLGNHYWHAKAAERIADLFFLTYNYDEAEKYSAEAAHYFEKSDRQVNLRYTLAMMAIFQSNNKKEEKAFELLDSLYTVCKMEQPADSALLEFIRPIMLEAGVEAGKIEITDFDSSELSKSKMSDREVIDAAIFQSRVYGADDVKDGWKNILEGIKNSAVTDEDRLHLMYAQYENAVAHGDDKFALSLVDSIFYYETSVVEKIVKESVAGAQRDFYAERSVTQEKTSSFLRLMLCLSILFFVIVIGFMITVYHLNNKLRKAELQAKIESLISLRAYSDRILHENEVLSNALDEKDLDAVRQALIVESLFKEKWTVVDILCNQYFSLNNSELTGKAVLSNLEKELKKILSKKGLSEIVEAVDKYMGGIMTRLGEQCTFLKEEDRCFLALIYAGFSVRAVCMFTGMSYQYFYVRKSRLIKRIQDSDAPDKELFISKIQ